MSDILSIGASGVRAYQAALTTVSENIANAGTVGYARRTATIREVAPVGGALSGNGALVVGVARGGDLYKSAAVRLAGADLARTQGAATWLDGIQGALTGSGLNERLSTFFNAGKAVAADPSASAPRAAMLEAAGAAASGFAQTGAALDDVAARIDATATAGAQRLTALGAALAKVNSGMSRASPGSAAAAGLADQRDQLLEEMSALVDVEATFDPVGRATVKAGGATLVAGGESGAVSYARNDEGAVAFAVTMNGEASAIAAGGGTLAGVADGAARVADARAAVNGLASGFASGVNAAQARGQGLDGKAGAAIFATGATPTDLTVTLADPAGIAAAATGGGTRDAANMAAFQTLRTDGAFEKKVTSLVSGNAAAIASRTTVAEAQAAIRDGAVAARDGAAGVDLDQEAVDLLRFQQAYQASGRVIQAAKDIFDSILAIA